MMMHANDPVPDVRALRPDTPDWLADLVHGLLAKNADDRPAGAATVAAALATRESLGGAATTVLPAAGAATTQRLDAVPPPPVVPPLPPTEPDRRGVVDPGLGARRGGRGRHRPAALDPAQDNGQIRQPPTLDPELDPEHVAAGRDHVAPPTTKRRRPRPPPPRRRPPRRRRAPATADLAADVEAVAVGVLRRGRRARARRRARQERRQDPRRRGRATSARRCATTTRRRCPRSPTSSSQDYDKGVQDGTITAGGDRASSTRCWPTSTTPSTPTRRAEPRRYSGVLPEVPTSCSANSGAGQPLDLGLRGRHPGRHPEPGRGLLVARAWSRTSRSPRARAAARPLAAACLAASRSAYQSDASTDSRVNSARNSGDSSVPALGGRPVGHDLEQRPQRRDRQRDGAVLEVGAGDPLVGHRDGGDRLREDARRPAARGAASPG